MSQSLLKPLLLIFVASLVLLCSNWAPVFAIAVAIASAIAIGDLYQLTVGGVRICFANVLAVSILLGYGVGSAIYLVSFSTIHAADYQRWLQQGFLFDQRGLSIALAASLLAASVLYVRAIYERSFDFHSALAHLDTRKSERLVWLGLGLIIFALMKGDLRFQGALVAATTGLSPIGALADLMVTGLVPYTLLLVTGNRPRAKRVLLIGICLFLIVVLAMLHRRYIIYALVLAAISLRMRGFRIRTKRGLVAFLGFSVVAIFVLYWGFKFFMAMRLAGWELGDDVGLLDQIRATLSMLGSHQASIVQQRLAQNVASRPFILSYLAGLMDISSAHMPSLGSEFLYSLQVAVPSVFMPGKSLYLPHAPEDFIHPLYGISVFDGPNSILVAGYDDFGFLGALIYPLIMVILYGAFFRAVQIIVRARPLQLFVLFILLFQLFYIEQGLASVFVTMRNLIIILGLAWMLLRLPVVKLNPRPRGTRHIPRKSDAATILRSRPSGPLDGRKT